MSRSLTTRALKGGMVWYVGKNDSWLGPYTTEEVTRRVKDGLLNWVDYIWAPTGGQGWSRICDLAVFQIHIPKPPGDDLLNEVKLAAKDLPRAIADAETQSVSMRPPSPAAAPTKVVAAPTPAPEVERRKTVERRRSAWFLQFEGSEFGPLTLNEIQVILKSGKLKGALLGWHEGMPTWLPIQDIPELQTVSEQVEGKSGKKEERRRSLRVPMVATVAYSLPSSAGHYTGVCRDINTEGMLILGNRAPSHFAAAFRIEVTPMGSSGVEPFLTEVELIRVLADGSGFSVRFRNLDAKTRSAIEKYMAKQEM